MLTNYSSAPLPKRKRLSYACNYCREKKTRCDEQLPTCRNCQLAGVPCVTVSKRRPHGPVQQRRRDPAMVATKATALASPETTAASRSPSMVTPEFAITSTRSRSASPVQRPSNQEWPNWETRHLPVISTQAGSSALQIFTQWFNLALARLRIPRTNYLRASLGPCLSTPSTCGYAVASVNPALPPPGELRRLAELFFKVYHPIFPFLEQKSIYSLIDRVPEMAQGSSRAEEARNVSRSMLLYLITILGTMAGPTVFEQTLTTYLGYCHSLMGHIILQPSVESVQALLLFSITLRLRDQLSQAWDGLTLAISMSRTIKFRDLSSHSQSIRQTMAESDKDPASTWWALYVFEKFLAFDSGRKACLDDPRLSAIGRKAPMEPSDHNRAPGSELGQYEHHVTSLANVLHEMQQRSWHTWRTQNLDTTTEMDARASKIRAAGAIDMMLSKWRGALPPEYQIGTSGSADVQLTPQWALLSFYYHQAIITLYRNTLLLDWTEVKAEVDRFGSGEPWHLRIRNAPQICLEAAKETINLQVMATEAGEPSYVSIGTSPLAAAYVLAIYIRRQPASILSRTHSEFMRAAIAISRQRYASHSAEGALNKALDMLQEYVAQLIGDAAASRSSVELNPDGNHRTLPIIGEVIPNSLNSPEYPWASFELLDWDWNELIPQT